MPAFDPKRLDDTAAQLQVEHSLPGLSIGVVQGHDLIYSRSFGLADIESAAPMTPDHRQRIASITKTMVGLCAMALVDERRLSLEDRVAAHLPDIPFNGHFDALTIRHLLTHTGGIGEVHDISKINDPFQFLFGPTVAGKSLAEAYAEGFTIEVEPGTKWAYANHGYFLLGEIIARVEGAPLHEVVHRRIFEPLGMANTDMLDCTHTDLSTPYHRAPGEDERELLLRAGREVPDEQPVDGVNIRGDFLPEWGRGAAGGVQSTVPDMARYASALLARAAGIVRPETFDSMIARHWDPHPALQAWGLSFGTRPSFGRRSFGHGGNAIGGWNSNLAVFPDDGVATIIHTNVTYQHFDRVHHKIRQTVLGAPDFVSADARVDPALLAAAPGVYEAPSPGPLTNFRVIVGLGRVQLSNRDGALVLHARRGDWKHGTRLVPIDSGHPDVFALDTGDDPDPKRVALSRNVSGNVVGLHFGGGDIWYMQRTDSVQPWA